MSDYSLLRSKINLHIPHYDVHLPLEVKLRRPTSAAASVGRRRGSELLHLVSSAADDAAFLCQIEEEK